MHPNGILRAFALGLAFSCARTSAALPPEKPPVLVLQAPPATSVNSVAVSPDGSLVATGAGEGGVRLYDAGTGVLRRAIGEAGDRSVAFSPDGRILAAAGYHMDKLVGIYDVETGRRLQALPGHTEWETYATAFSPDGKLLASTGADRQILVWDLATGKLRHRLATQGPFISSLAFSPDGATLAGGGEDRAIRLWDLESGRLRRTLEGHRDWVCTVAFSPDGTTIAGGTCDWAYHRGRNTAEFSGRDPGCTGEWKLWDAATGDVRRTVTEPGRLRSLAFAPDGRSLACAIGKDVRLYDLRDESPGRVVTTYDFDATSVAFTPDGAAIVSGSHDQTVRRVAAVSGEVAWEVPGSWEQVNSVALSADGSLLATGSSDRRFAVRTLKAGSDGLKPGAARLWDARTGRLLRRLAGPAEQVMAVAISPDGRSVAAGAGGGPDGKGVVRVWDAATGTPAWSVDDHAAEVLAVAYAPDGSVLATAGADGLVRLRDPRTGTALRTLDGHEGGATSLAFSPDGSMLACGEGRGGTRLWDARSGRLLHACRDEASRAATVDTDRLITSVSFSADGGTLATCAATVGNTFGEPVRLWDTRTGKLRRGFADQEGRGRPMALSPDGTVLATGGKTIKLWDARTGKKLRELAGYLKKTQSIAFSADGRLLFSGGSYGTTNAWEVATGRHLVTLFAFPRGDDAAADDWLAYHPDGYYDGSPGVERYLAWRVGDELLTPDSLGPELHRPDRIEAALKLSFAGPRAPGHADVADAPKAARRTLRIGSPSRSLPR